MAQVANENTGSQLAAVQRAVIAGKRDADVGPDFNWNKMPMGAMSYRNL